MSIRILFFSLVLHFFLLEAKSAVRNRGDSTNQAYLNAQKCFSAANYDCAQKQYVVALGQAREEGQYKLTAQCYLDLGLLMYQLAEFDSAVSYLDSAIEVSSEFNFLSIIAGAKQQIAHIDWRFGDNYAAVSNIKASIDLYENLQDTSALLKAKTILGGIYISLKKFEESASVYKGLLESAKSTNDTIAMTICNEHLGVIEYYKGNYDKARALYTAALTLNRKLNRELAAALNLANIGEAYLASNNLNEANEYLQKSLKILSRYEFNSGIIFVYHSIGSVNNKLKKYNLANDYYHKSLDLMEQTGEIREKNYVYQLISQNMQDKGDFQEALSYFKKYTFAKDSLFGIEKTRQLEELRTQYQLEESEVKNQALYLENAKAQKEIYTQENLIRYQYLILIITLGSLVLFIFQLYFLRKSKRKLEVANNTKDRLFNIIAHDIRNPVGNIGALITIMEASNDEAEKLKLMGLLKQSSGAITNLVNSILSWSISNTHGFQFNLKDLKLYDLIEQSIGLFIIQIEEKKIKLNNRVAVDYHAEFDEDVVSTIVRNLLSNAIKFTPENGQVSIWVDVTSDFHVIHVKDSGVGLDKGTLNHVLSGHNVSSQKGTQDEKGSGIGFTLINDLVDKLHGKIEIITEVNLGTEVIVFLPTVNPNA
ncbi:MAG: signal transduction histidine kinase [Marivirga sp.]|jgi:signal transduction histidine kinase